MVNIRIALALLVVSLFAASCKNSTETTSNTMTRPGVGSSFVLHSTSFDSLGNPLPAYEKWDTAFVISSGITYQGKTNVVAIRYGSDPKGRVTYGNYESNGDLSSYADGRGAAGERSGWELSPIASQGTTQFVGYDTTYIVGGNTHHSTRTDINTYAGQQTVTEAGQSFNAIMISERDQLEDGYSDYTSTQWIAPSIGFLVRDNTTNTHPSPEARSETHLVSYTLK